MTVATTSFTTRDVPWMKVGTTIDEPNVTAARAAELAGIDFTVSKRRAAFELASGGSWRVAPQKYALVRDDTETLFAYVSNVYKPVQYADAFAFMDEVNPRYVAAGAFSNGRQGFMVVQLPECASFDPAPLGESDPHDLYVVLRTSHDLSKAIEVAVLPLRGRCMNQLPLPSFAKDAPQRWAIPHTGDPLRKLKDARDALQRTTRYAEVFSGTVRQLASVRVTDDGLRSVLKRVLPDRVKRDDQVTAIVGAFHDAERVAFPGTGWAAVNAVSEYFEHRRDDGTRTAQSRFTGGLNGETAKYVRRTAQVLQHHA